MSYDPCYSWDRCDICRPCPRPCPCPCPGPTPETFTLSGRFLGLTDASGLLVQYTINGVSGSTMTDAMGLFSITVPRGANVTITPPAVAGFTVAPANYTLNCVMADRSNLDFTYTNAGQVASISGRLLGLGCSMGLPLRLIVDGVQQTVRTNAQGEFSFQVPVGSVLVLTPPTQEGYSVAPLHHFIARVIGSTSNLNFQYLPNLV